MDALKQRQMIDRIDAHLRKTARRMVQFDTIDETLHYLIDSFFQQFPCDYMSIIIADNGVLIPRITRGITSRFDQCFPLRTDACLPQILEGPLCSFDVIKGKDGCSFLSCLDEENFQTWFTIPIRREDDSSLGLCVIGFRSFVPLVLEGSKLFGEYGRDIATAFDLALQKETEYNKVKGLEWLRDNAYLVDHSIEEIIEKIVEHAGKGTLARAAVVYLYDEAANRLVLQEPIYGDFKPLSKIGLNENYDLKAVFPYLEKHGGPEITIPLILNLKMVGVLHVIQQEGKSFSGENLELLQFLANHVSTLIENAKLYRNEKESNSRMETFMHQQQELVKHTLEGQGFAGITDFLSGMLSSSILLFDRFFHLTVRRFLETDEPLHEAILDAVHREKRSIMKSMRNEHWITEAGVFQLGLWRVDAGGDSVGYLGVLIPRERMDTVLRMTLNHALNVYAVQFIKQKLVLDVREQVKDSFFNQLLVEHIEDDGKILEYANLLNWNIQQPHSIGLFSFHFDKSKAEHQTSNLLQDEAKKNRIWELIRDHCVRKDPAILLTRKEGNYMAIVPEESTRGDFWGTFYERITRQIKTEMDHVTFHIGISQESKRLEDYYFCYKQAQKTLTILSNRFPQKGYMLFNQLGSYMVLYQASDPVSVSLFIRTYLGTLLQVGKNKDLFDTLRVYLQTNGSIKDTANILFIHRSSLKYRLDKIRQIMDLDIDDAEQRFNITLAYKLYDLFGEGS